MRQKNKKVQITLPDEIVQEIERELKESYLSKSGWFLKVAKEALDKRRKKKVLELNI